MIKVLVNLKEEDNRVVNIVKGKFGLSNKSEAISLIIEEYENELLEPELRPEFVEKMKEREKEEVVHVKDFGKHFGLKNV